MQAVTNLVGNMPKDFRKTVKELRKFLHDDEVSTILASPDYKTANEKIVTIVMFRSLKSRTQLCLCEILESVTDAPALTMTLRTLRRSKYISCEICDMVC